MTVRLLKMTQENCCMEEKRVTRFEPGINGFLGPQGSGKSNALRMLQYALTGVLPPGETKEKNVRRVPGADVVEGRVSLDFLYDEQEARVWRNLHDSKCCLSLGAREVKGSRNIDEEMENILGATSYVTSAMVFIRQGKLTETMVARPADRAKLILQLFNLERFEAFRRAMDEDRKNYVVPEPLEKPEGLQQAITACLGELDGVGKAITVLLDQEAAEPESLDAMRRRAFTMEANNNAYNHPDTGYLATGVWHDMEANVALPDAQATLKDQEVQLVILRARNAQALVDARKATQRLQLQELRSAAEGRLNRLVEQHEATLTVVIDDPPVVEDLDTEVQASEQELRQLEVEVGGKKSFCSNFKAGGCPVCGTVKVVGKDGKEVDVTSQLAAFGQSIAELEPKVATLRSDIAEYRKCRSAYLTNLQLVRARRQSHETYLASLVRDVRIAKQEFQAFGPPVDASADTRVVDESARTSEELVAYESLVRTTAAGVEARVRTVKELRASLDKLKALERGDTTTLRASLKHREDRASEITRLTVTADMLEVRLRELQRRHEAAEEQMRQYRTRGAYADLLGAAIDVFHRDNYPRMKAVRYFGQINDEWNATLSELDVPFSVELKDDTSIVVTTPTGKEDIERCSGGQQCCAAFSMILALNRLFAGSVGLLALDEPTYGMDPVHLDRLAGLLSRTQRYAASAGLQIFISTHEERLLAGFNHTIRFGESLAA